MDQVDRNGAQSKGAPKNILALGMVSFFTDTASSMVTPILPLFMVLVLAEGVDKIGFVLAITTIVSYALRFVGGYLSDKFDRNKPLLLIGYGLSSISKPFLAFAGSWQSVAALRSSERLGKALRAAPKDKLISLSAPEGKVGKSFGLQKTLDVAGEFSGLLIVFAVLALLGSSESVFRDVFLASIIPGIAGMLVLTFFVRDLKEKHHRQAKIKFSLEDSVRAPVLIFCAMSLFMMTDAFFVLVGNEMGFSVPSIILLLVAMRGGQALLTYQIGKAMDHFKVFHIFGIGYLLGVIALALLFVPNIFTLALAFVVWGIHDVMTLTSVRVIIGGRAKDKGANFGSFYLLYAVSAAIGLAVLGIVWENFGRESTVSLSLGGVTIVGLIMLVLSRQ